MGAIAATIAGSVGTGKVTVLRAASAVSRRRLCLLIAAVVLMGLADLLFTLTYMRSVGMFEYNPIARMLATAGDVPLLVSFKLFSIGVSAVGLFAGRRHPMTEKVAWCCTVLLFVLMMHWVSYNAKISTLTNEVATIAMAEEAVEMWVKLER